MIHTIISWAGPTFLLITTGVQGTEREVSLLMKHGVEAKSYEDVSISTKTMDIITHSFIIIWIQYFNRLEKFGYVCDTT